MIKVNVTKGALEQSEIDTYINRALDLYPDRKIASMDIAVDGDFVDIFYRYDNVPFQRIRRITGYLVGTLDRFNNAKRSEVEDRVTHGLENDACDEIYIYDMNMCKCQAN